ncbi:MAG TPA: glycosyltransferase family A protein [Pirellulales bacterium]|jgi:hypothetical protein|nr:glycosyltransferase family A protein [Pirellulales bacterium]
MIHYTVLVPQRDSIAAVRDLVPRLCRVFESLLLPYEIICIDDGSTAIGWEELLFEFAPLRVLHFDSVRGTSAALTAGIAAARGDLIVAIAPQTRLSVDTIPQLIARLSQNDLVVARPEQSFGLQVRSALSKISRILVGEPQLSASEEMYWAARREAVCGLALARGAFRVLSELVAEGGFRVCELTFGERRPPQGVQFHPGVVRRTAIGWFHRRFEPHLARELVRSGTTPHLKIVRVEVPLRQVPQAELVPLEKDHRDSA